MLLTPSEQLLVNGIGFDSVVAELFKTAARQPLLEFDPTGQNLAGVAVKVADGSVAETFINSIQPELIKHGYRAFWTDLPEESGLKTGSAVAILHSTDHFAILDAVKPSAEDHDGPEVIHEKLKSYERLCNLEIVGAASDWVATTFKNLPDNLCAFAEDVYLLCPNSCDFNSGIGSIKKITKDTRVAAKALCPEVSESFRQQLKLKHSRNLEVAIFPPEFYAMLQEDAEWNVRLLAWELREKMYFFFWWD